MSSDEQETLNKKIGYQIYKINKLQETRDNAEKEIRNVAKELRRLRKHAEVKQK